MSANETAIAAPSSHAMPHWDACAELAPSGTWLLEASAGTGKTWQLASLVARLVIEQGVPIARILIITFTNAATAELRGRVRDRLSEVRELLEARPELADAHARRLASDAVLRRLCDVQGEQRAQRLLRAKVALSSFDLAPISTIHGFCQRMLDTLAFESGQDAGLTLLEDLGPIQTQLVADALASVQARASARELAQWRQAGWDAKTLLATVKAAAAVSGAAIEPALSGAPQLVPAALADAVQALAGFWQAEGASLVEALCADIDARRAHWVGSLQPENVRERAAEIDAWCVGSDPFDPIDSKAKQLGAAFLRGKLTRNKKVQGEPFDDPRPEQLDALLEALAQARQTVAPLAAFAHASRAAVRQALLERRALTFDAILTRLAEAIEDEANRGGARPLAEAIAGQFDAAFIDEFQDTDLAQWRVLHDVFVRREGKRLFLIGDPKQAIYAFRGADVFVYLAAKAVVPVKPTLQAEGGRYTMGVNWRSDGPLVKAVEAFWRPGSRAFGDLDMDFVAVEAAPSHADWGLQGGGLVARMTGEATARCPLEIRWLDGGAEPDDVALRAPISNGGQATAVAAACCAREIRRLLDSDATLPAVDAAGQPIRRALKPGDFAVLVHTHKQAAQAQRALSRHGILSIRAGKDTVWTSDVATWLLQLLDAIAEPGHEAAARTVAVSPLFGHSLADLAAALARADLDAPARPDLDAQKSSAAREGRRALDWQAWREAIAGWASQWPKRRFVGVIQRILVEHDVLAQLLAFEDGERLATDLRHLIELCHIAERQHYLGPAGLAAWVRKQREGQAEGDSASPRLESDAEAVQVVTIFKAKGLQYPIVMLPFGWNKGGGPGKLDPIVVHAQGAGAAGNTGSVGPASAFAVTDLHPPDSDIRKERMALHAQERQQERIRQLYVAMTRAEHHCVVWAGPLGRDFREAAVHAVMLRGERDDGDAFAMMATDFKMLCKGTRSTREAELAKNREGRLAAQALLWARLAELVARGQGQLGWSLDSEPPRPGARWQDRAARLVTPEPLAVEVFDPRSHLNSAWMRASYSSMHAGRTFEDTALEADKHLALVDDHLRGGRDDDDLQLVSAAEDGSAAAARVDLPLPADAPPEPEPMVTGAPEDGLPPAALPLATMWGGTTVGTWAHSVLEHLDFAPKRPLTPADFAAWRLEDDDARDAALADSPYFGREVPGEKPVKAADLIAALGGSHGHRRGRDHALLTLALPHILGAPLSDPRLGDHALRPGTCLSDIALKDRIDELAFDLSLMGGEAWPCRVGDRSGPGIDADQVTAALALRATTAADAAQPWDGAGWLHHLLDRVATSAAAHADWSAQDPLTRGTEPSQFAILPRIAGLLTGFVDLVFRAPCADGQIRYFLADYKTNKLTTPGQRETRPGHYSRPWLAWSMGHASYHLQGLIYSLAMHRFLRERVADYDYDAHFGGHLYLYVRGMMADDRGRFDDSLRGVYADRWPRQVIEALDVALDPALEVRRGAA